MTEQFAFLFLIAHIIAWLVGGRTWGAAFKAPLVVLVPAAALFFAYVTMSDGYGLVPAYAAPAFSCMAMWLFGVMCLRIAVPKPKPAAAKA